MWKKGERRKWVAENMKAAIEAVRGGEMGILLASKKFCVPHTTLQRMARSNKSFEELLATRLGRPPTSSPNMENRNVPSKVPTVYQDESINIHRTQSIKVEQINSDFEDANINNNANDEMTYEHELHLSTKVAAVYRDESVDSNIKIEQNRLDLDDRSTTENANDNASYEDNEATNLSRRLHINPINDEISKTYRPLRKSKKTSNTLCHNKNPLQLPIAKQQQQQRQQPPSEPFESHNADTNSSSTLTIAIEDEIKKANDEDFINIEEELDAIQNLIPRSKESKKLQDELFKAETEYYRCKAAYFTKLTENCTIKKTLMLLESRKLQLEIKKLSSES